MAVELHKQALAAETGPAESSGSPSARFLFQAEEAERRRLARELHDDTAQGLTLVRFSLGMVQQLTAEEKTRKAIDEAFVVLDRTIEGLRRIVSRLSPQALEKFGLIGSIRKEARNLASSRGLQVRVKVSDGFGRLSAEAELALYRLIQEALHNIAKHANARRIGIDLSRKDGEVNLRIEDDGTGFVRKSGTRTHTFGIFGMRERIRSLNGTFRIRSQRGGGTRIEVSLSDPLPPASQPTHVPQLRVVKGRQVQAPRQSQSSSSQHGRAATYRRYRHA